MSVSVQNKLNAGRRTLGRNVHEKKAPVIPLQYQGQRPEIVRFVISQDNVQRFAQLFELGQRFRIAYVAEMPDFISRLQPVGQTRRITVVGIGDNGNFQHFISKQDIFPAAKTDAAPLKKEIWWAHTDLNREPRDYELAFWVSTTTHPCPQLGPLCPLLLL